ncbi:spindle pole body component 110-like protein [Gossypium australe]|uniref:Spindle pole body component 110-like protein n=1 Tax=Gossypium australe TaxID=47621 RepID=A0A5B6VIS8_9ROSI|nr:spindle pole body component 110-like protein [Gossypium australe]
MENGFLDKVEDNAAVRIWSEKTQLEKGDSLMEGYVLELWDFTRISVTQNNIQDPAYNCFTFGKVDLVPTVEEYTTLLRCLKIQADKAYFSAANVLTFLKKLMSITGMNMKKRVDVFALSIYGLVVFPKVLEHIDEAVSDLFDRLNKGFTPVLAILAKTFKSLNACQKAGEDVEWMAHWMIPDEILYRCGDFDWVPLLGIWGAVGYAPLLVLRQYRSRVNDNIFLPSQEGTRPMEEHLQVIPSMLEIIKQDFEKRNLELGKKIEQLEEEKMQLGLDVDVQKLEAKKLRKGKNKAEEDLDSLKTNYKKLRLLIRTVGLEKTSEKWRQEMKEEKSRADQWENKFQDAQVREEALERSLSEGQNEKIGLKAWVAELEKSLHQYRSRNSTIELKVSLNKTGELKRNIEELEITLQNCELRFELLEANNEHWKEQLHCFQGQVRDRDHIMSEAVAQASTLAPMNYQTGSGSNPGDNPTNPVVPDLDDMAEMEKKGVELPKQLEDLCRLLEEKVRAMENVDYHCWVDAKDLSLYAQRWREVAAQVQPSLLEKETKMLSINTLKALFINHMLESATKSFSDIVMSGEMIENVVRSGKIDAGENAKRAAPRKKEHEVNKASLYNKRELYQSVFDAYVVSPFYLKPMQPLFPKWYDANAQCEYHAGITGHSIENCTAFKKLIEWFIKMGIILFNDPSGPNVEGNPLPSHSGKGAKIDVAEKPVAFPYKDSKRVPWNYDCNVTISGEENSTSALEEGQDVGFYTCSGRHYDPASTRTEPVKGKTPTAEYKKEKTARLESPVNEPITENEAREFLKFLKHNEYSVVEQLHKQPARISVLALLLSLETHHSTLMKVLNETYVANDISVNKLGLLVNNISAENFIFFNDDKIPPGGHGIYIAKGANRQWLYTERLTSIHAEQITSGQLSHEDMPKHNFLVMDIKPSYNCLLGRPSIYSVGAVPSSLHQKLKLATKGYKLDARQKKRELEKKQERKRVQLSREEVKWEPMTFLHISRTFVSGETIHPEQKMSRKETVEEMSPDINDMSDAATNSESLFEQDMLNTDIVVHQLPIKKECKPIQQKLRRMMPDVLLKIKKKVKKQFDAGFLQVVKYSEWVANVIPFPKKDGKV